MNRTHVLSLALAACAACSESNVDEESGESSESRYPDVPFMDGTIESDWEPLKADESYEGKTLTEWAIEFTRWRYSQNTCDIPAFDQDGSQCFDLQDPESPVVFLDFSPTTRVRTKCRIPYGKAVVVPIMTFSNDNAGVEPPVSEEELIELTDTVLESMRDLKLRVDNRSIDDISERRIETTKFQYTVPAAPNWYSCKGTPNVANTTVDPAYFAGYAAVFPPPDPGVHELHYAGVMTLSSNDYAIDTRTRFVIEDN